MQNATENATVGAVAVPAFRTAPNRGDLTLKEWADAYMASYTGRSTPTGTLAMWVRELGSLRVVDITPDHVADVLERYAQEPVVKFAGRDPVSGERILRAHGRRAPATINRVRSVLSGVLTHAKKKRITPRGWTNPCREIAAEEMDNARTRFLTPEERDRLLKVARASAWPRMYLLVLMAITTGARRGELLALRYGDLDLERCTAHVRKSKNGTQRVCPLTAEVVAEIKRHGKAAPERLLFDSHRRPGKPMTVNKTFPDLVKAAQIEDFHFHDLRHTAASILAMKGATLLELADVLGHSTLDMVKRYAHLTVGHKAALVNRVMGGIA